MEFASYFTDGMNWLTAAKWTVQLLVVICALLVIVCWVVFPVLVFIAAERIRKILIQIRDIHQAAANERERAAWRSEKQQHEIQRGR